MTPADSPMPEDHEAALLAAYDEALAASGPSTLDERALAALDPEAATRLREDLESLRLLEEQWPRSGAARSDPAASSGPVPGISAEVGRFRILRELGRGGHGVVLLAFDRALKRQVALKVPRPEMLLTREMRQRFLHEARTVAGLDHPGIVPVYEAGEDGLVCYIVSAYCPGNALSEWLREQPEPVVPRTAAALVAQLAEAVAYTHGRGILHRDLKPANVLLAPRAEGEEGPAELPFFPRLTDFGLAKTLEATLVETRSSMILGTPLYMAPEQVDARTAEVGPATDIYGLGVILYEVLAGRPPFLGASVVGVLDQIRTQEPPELRRLRPDIPAELATICHKCLQKNPAQRYTSAGELAADLRAWLRGEPITARLPGPLARLNAWSLRRERIRDAGLLTIAINATVSFWSTVTLCGMFLGIGTPLDMPAAILQIVFTLAGFLVPLIWFGFKILAGRPWALGAGLVLSLLTLGSVLFNLAFPEQFDAAGIHRDLAERFKILALFIFLYTVQTAGLLLSLRAYYHLPRE